MSGADFQVIADIGCKLGEGPVWHPHEGVLYWTDIEGGRLWRYEPGGEAEVVYEGQRVGGFTVQADGALLLFRERGNVVIWDKGQVRSVVVEQIQGHEEERFNDVYADPMGRVYAGTVCPGMMGRLIRLDVDGGWHEVLSGIACSNGMDLTADQGKMYYTDSEMRTIWRYSYDQSSGGLYDREVFVEVGEGEGKPDGLAVDREGHVWSARWGGWGVYQYGCDGEVKRKIDLPAAWTSSLCFGGEGYDELYVTSAGGDSKDELGEYAGAVFKVKVDVGGREPYLSRVSC